MMLADWQKWTLTSLSLLLIGLAAAPSFAVEPKFFAAPPEPPTIGMKGFSFLSPNELRPADAREILESAPKGIVVGVGTERLYFDFLLAKNATHILCVDRDPQVKMFHILHGLLMRMTPHGDIARYRALRFQGDEDLWERQSQWAHANKRITDQEFAWINTHAPFSWWNDFITYELRWDTPPAATLPFTDGTHLSASDDLNYIADAQAFGRLQTVFEQQHFQAHNLNFKAAEDVAPLVKALAQTHLTVSVLDLSNAPETPTYLGTELADQVVRLFAPVTQPDSVVLITRLMRRTIRKGKRVTDYAGFQYSALNANPNLFGETVATFYSKDPQVRAHERAIFERLQIDCTQSLTQGSRQWGVKLKLVPSTVAK